MIVAMWGASVWYLHQQLHYPLLLWTNATLAYFRLALSLRRYGHSAGSSFSFIAVGAAMGTVGEGAELLVALGETAWWVVGVGRLLSTGGSYLIMHGSLHQSNLQQGINQINGLIKRNY